MKLVSYSHRHGEPEVPAPLRNELSAIVKGCKTKLVKGNLKDCRSELLSALLANGWSPEVSIDSASKISVTSIKSRVGLCLQTGNMSRMYADLMKLQTLYLREVINAGVMILPEDSAAKELGDNLANYDRMVRELPIFERVITAPLWVIGLLE